MIDTLFQGTTWRREVVIVDGSGNPVDPTEIVAVLCPATTITVTQTAPGNYEVLLDETETALVAVGMTHWEMRGRLNGDLVMLVYQVLRVDPMCVVTP